MSDNGMVIKDLDSGPHFEFHTKWDFVGPEEDMDLLEKVRWNMVGMADETGKPSSFVAVTRRSANSVVVEGFAYEALDL